MALFSVGVAPLVSFVMPAWQPRGPWLLQAVSNVLAEPDCELELIVVDDGSPERVADLLASITDPRLRVLRVSHGGVSHARNAGTAAARGDLFRFIDCDDLLAPGSTARLIAHMRGERVIGYGATVWCDDEMRPVRTDTCTLEGDVREACLCGGFPVMIPAMCFPRAVVEAVGDWDVELPVSQDWDFVLRALDHATVRGDGTPALYYRRHGASNSNVPALDRSVKSWRRILNRYLERHPEHDGTRIARRANAQLAVHHAARVGQVAGSLKSYGRALQLDPATAVHGLIEHARKRVTRLLRRH